MKAIWVALCLLFVVSCHVPGPPEWPHPHEDEIWKSAAGENLVMHKAPIFVYADPEVAVASKNAVDTWNGWLGFDLLRFTPTSEDADIYVMSMQPNSLYAGLTGVYPNGKRAIALATLRPAVVVHEFGHALGLDHDEDNKRSVMYPSTQDTVLPWLEERDRLVLRRHYRPLYQKATRESLRPY